MANLYQILGVSKTATTQEIKKAFRSLAKEYHPDKNRSNTYADEQFKQINEAYQVLSDNDKKAQYDLILNYSSVYATQSYTVKRDVRTSPPYRSKESAVTAEHLAKKAQRKKEQHLKAFNRMATFLLVFVFLFGSIIAVVEYDKIKKEEKRIALIHSREMKIKALVNSLKNLVLKKNFKKAYLNVEAQRSMNSSTVDISLIKINEALLSEANKMYEQQNYKQASIDYNLYLQESYDQNPIVALRTANCYLQLNNTILAESTFTKTCDYLIASYIRFHGLNYYYNMNPEYIEEYHFEAFLGKGMAAYANANYSKSLIAFTFAQYLRPNHPIIYKHLALANEALGDIEQAVLNREVQKEKELVIIEEK